MSVVWSSGGGTQSAAIAALIVAGRLPKPDFAVIVDTEREKSATWEYHEAVVVPRLREVKVELVRVRKSEYSSVGLYDTHGKVLIPAYTTQSGQISKMRAYCSNEWKKRVAFRWMRAQGVQSCDNWLGISVDEAKRMAFSGTGWVVNRYPLIEREYGLQWRRQDCIAFLEAQGWPTAPRSACWMCPHMTTREWNEMRSTHPKDFEKAQTLEAEIREGDPHVWLQRGFLLGDKQDAQEVLPGMGCEGGICFV